MAETSLRAYVREIDDLIEHEQLDEAIAHARHILQTYPRHLDTYRLLGKAYLEAKRYGDSADILQRVLSAVPDDFVAHVGMSIVREDEGNLDAAIWHMERAFETNPSNAAVQGELRRLLGKRDGLEPHKVRLTRGALARMYAHGELYPQAIAELRAALTEDPDRPDLQVLLADMYWRTNQRAEAAEVSSAILATLPNCREANRIMAAALHSQGRMEEALTYHRRVAALDPYSALVETIQEDASSVDSNAVRIEKVAWQPGQPVGRDTGPAGWAAAGGAARPATPRPSWLDSLGAETQARAAAAAAAQRAEAARRAEAAQPVEASVSTPTVQADQPAAEPAGPIPEWMQAAGWKPGTGDVPEGPVSFSDDELRSLEAGMLPPDAAPEPEDGLARADIPDWLKDVAPPGADEEAFDAAAAASAGPTGPAGEAGLDEPRLPPGWSAPEPGASGDEDDWLKAAAEESPAVPTWMEEQSPGATATIVTWLGDRSRHETPATPRMQAEATSEPEREAGPEPAELPEWLADQAAAAEGEEPVGAEAGGSPPSWLSGVAEAAAKGSTLAPEEVAWDQGSPAEPIQTGMYPESEAPAQPAELPEWLQTIAGADSASRIQARDGAGPEWMQPEPTRQPAPTPAPSEAGSESFGWLRELAESEPPTPAAPTEAPPPSWMAEPPAGARATLGRSAGPEWLRGIAEPEPTGGQDTSSMDWLRGIAEAPTEGSETPAGPVSTDQPRPEESAEWLSLVNAANPQADSTTTGEWLRLLKEEGVPSERGPIPPAAVAATVAASAAAPPGELDDAQVFDWLETLAAKQGIPAPEAISEGPVPVPPPAAAARPETAKPIPEEPDAGMKWLEELAAEQTPGPVQPVAVASAPTGPEIPPPPTVPAAAMAPATPEAVTVVPPSEPSPEVPDWLKQLVAETPAAEVPSAEAVPPAAETWPSLPEWMVTPQPAEDEPTVPPLPPPVAIAAVPAAAEPIDELAETWVPPWEQLAEEPGAPATGPTDETVVHRPPPAAMEPARAVPSEPEPVLEEEPEPVAPEPPRYTEPTTDVLEEVPDWLRTTAPRQRAAASAPTPEPEAVAEPAYTEEFEVPDWLTPPPVAAAEPLAPPDQTRARAVEKAVPQTPAQVPVPPPVISPPVPEPMQPVAPAPATIVAAKKAEQRRPEPVPPALPPAAEAPKPPLRAPKPKAASPGMEDKLIEARHALAMGDYRRAASQYAVVIKRKYQLDEVTSELELALNRNPKAAPLWQALGDAYMKSDRIPDAIGAYERGMAAA